MAQKIIILGGLLDGHDRPTLLQKLRQKSGVGYDWDWIKATDKDNWAPPAKYVNGFRGAMLTPLQPGETRPRVAILHNLHGSTQGLVYKIAVEPILIPAWIDTGDQLCDWICSPDAGIIPSREWQTNLRIACFIAILVKLIKNKSFNKDRQGHAWTKESDLLGQAPVTTVPYCAPDILAMMGELMLIRKGGKQGKTPLEWCINTSILPAVKQVMISQSLDPLRQIKALSGLLNHLEDAALPTAHPCHEIISEKVLAICRDKPRPP